MIPTIPALGGGSAPGCRRWIARASGLVTAVALALLAALSSATSANAAPIGNFDVAMVATCDNGYHTLFTYAEATPLRYDGSLSTVYHGYRIAYRYNNSSVWSYTSWNMAYGTFHSPPVSNSFPPGRYALMLQYAVWSGSGFVYYNINVAHNQQYLDRNAYYSGASCVV
jgi:hypothetical protein